FSGRPARALVNRFLLDHPDVPAGYPEINNATRPLRARAAAAGDAGGVSLYAGEGVRAAADRPAAEIVGPLAAPLPVCPPPGQPAALLPLCPGPGGPPR